METPYPGPHLGWGENIPIMATTKQATSDGETLADISTTNFKIKVLGKNRLCHVYLQAERSGHWRRND